MILMFWRQTSASYLEKAWALEDQGRYDDAERVYRKVADVTVHACDKPMYSKYLPLAFDARMRCFVFA